jgi:peroxiredoxin
LRDRIKDFHQRNAQILVVDPHETYRLRHMLREAEMQSGELAFPLLADPAFTVSATYGVAFQMNIHTEWSNRPATFLIDKSGVLRYERRARTFDDRPKPEELLRQLDELAGRSP